MASDRLLALAYGSLLALAFIGSYALGEDSWMAWLLLIPSAMILAAMGGTTVRIALRRPGRVAVARYLRIGAALVALTIPAALLCEALGGGELVKTLAVLAVLLLTSLVDREYFGWTSADDAVDPSSTGYSSSEYDSQRSSRLPPTRL